jgi:hypothetical protein
VRRQKRHSTYDQSNLVRLGRTSTPFDILLQTGPDSALILPEMPLPSSCYTILLPNNASLTVVLQKQHASRPRGDPRCRYGLGESCFSPESCQPYHKDRSSKEQMDSLQRNQQNWRGMKVVLTDETLSSWLSPTSERGGWRKVIPGSLCSSPRSMHVLMHQHGTPVGLPRIG